MRVESRAPARVDLAGGTVDIWPLYLFHPGAQTVNIAIRCYASCVIDTRADRRIVLESQDQELQESWDSLTDLSHGVSKLPLLQELVMFFEPQRGLNITTRS
jgi:D-glycero-alpha-D-manno-heptose-7-phosphate kinase